MLVPAGPGHRLLLGCSLALLCACSGGGSSGHGGGNGGGGGGGTPQDTSAPQVLSGPVLNPDPSGFAPLTATLDVATDEPAELIVGIDDGARSWEIRPQDFQTVHSLPLVGLRPNRSHQITLQLADMAGNRTSPFHFTLDTPPLPAEFPPLTTTVYQPTRTEPGLTGFAAEFIRQDLTDGGFIVLLDDTGEVYWYYFNPQFQPRDVEFTRSGTMLFLDDIMAVEIDLLGNTLNRWWPARLDPAGTPPGAIPVDVDTFHHEFYELPEGQGADFLVLSTELRVLPDYPISEIDPTMTTPSGRVAGDVLVEFDRDGTVVRRLRYLDLFDPYRLVYESLAGYWVPTYGPPCFDWSHGNAAFLDTRDNTYLVSMRHQDAVVKIDRDTGAILWILGAPDRWMFPWSDKLLTPVGTPFEWQFHQHSPKINSRGNVILFDNGNHRAIPPNPSMPSSQWYSRAVEYSVDPSARTVTQVWSYGGPPDTWGSFFLGDADTLPATGNVMITDGAIMEGNGRRSARLLEVTGDPVSQPVVEIRVADPTAATSWFIYRSVRLSSF